MSKLGDWLRDLSGKISGKSEDVDSTGNKIGDFLGNVSEGFGNFADAVEGKKSNAIQINELLPYVLLFFLVVIMSQKKK
ncbi:MAG: hypothetical protein ACYDEX_21970 [Mobilitalea sp.]